MHGWQAKPWGLGAVYSEACTNEGEMSMRGQLLLVGEIDGVVGVCGAGKNGGRFGTGQGLERGWWRENLDWQDTSHIDTNQLWLRVVRNDHRPRLSGMALVSVMGACKAVDHICFSFFCALRVGRHMA